MSVLGTALRWHQNRQAREADEQRRARVAALIGHDLDPPKRPSWKRQAAVAAGGMAWRHRVMLAPFAGLGALWASGAVLGTPDGAAPIWLCWVLGALAWWPARWRRLRRARDRQYAAAVWAGALLWLLLAQLAGVSSVAWLLVVLVAVGAAPWWYRHRLRPRPTDPPEVVDDSFAARWDAGVGAQGKAAPGSYLTDPEVTEHFTQYRLVCVPGAPSQTEAGMNANLPRIATGVRTPKEQLLIERHPIIRDPSQLLVKELHHSPSDEVEYLDVPRYRDGVVYLGDHTDKDGEAGLRVYAPDGMFGGALIGSSGIGKSRLLDTFVLSLRWAWMQYGIPTAVIYLDGQSGASSPTLWKHATVAAGPDEADEVLDCLDRAAGSRQAWNRHYGLTGFTPGYSPEEGVQGLTGMLVVGDEHHRIAQGRGKRLAHIAQERRKIGQALWGSDQLSELKSFGNEEGLRSSLFNGNAVIMHVSSRSQGNLVPGLSIHPADLPAIPGYGVKVSKPGSGERTAPFRSRYLPSEKDRADGRAPADVRTVEEWFDATEDAPLDDMTAKAFAPLFEKRAAREAERAERDRRLMNGETLELEAATKAPAGREKVTAGQEGGTVLSLLSGLLDRGTDSAPVKARAAQVAVAQSGPVRERIPAVLRAKGRAMSRQELADQLEVTPGAVTQALAKAEGVVRVADGWDLVERAQTSA